MARGRVRDVEAKKNTVDEAVMAQLDAKLAKDPADPELWFAKGQEYFGCEFDKAIDCFSMAIALSPFNYDYYFNRGRKFVSLDQWERGLADFKMAIRLDPTDGLEWHYAGVCCFYMGRYEQASEYFKSAIAHHRANGVHLVWPEVDWIYMACMHCGKKEEALAALDYVADDEPIQETDYGYMKRVKLYKQLITPEEYYEQVDRSSTLYEMSELFALFNYYYYQVGDKEKARPIIDKVLAFPEYHCAFAYKSALIAKQVLYGEDACEPEKEAELQVQLANDPENAELWFSLGQVYFEKRWPEAIKCFSRCIALDPFASKYYFNRGRKWLSMDEFEFALADFVTALRFDTETDQKWHYAGVACFYLGRYDAAVEYFKKSIATSIKYNGELVPPSTDWCWMSYQKMGKEDEALKVLDNVTPETRVGYDDRDYLKRVLLYQDKLDPEAYYANIDKHDELVGMAELYGLCNYYYYVRKDVKRSVELMEEVLAYKTWHHAFAYKSSLREIESRKAELL